MAMNFLNPFDTLIPKNPIFIFCQISGLATSGASGVSLGRILGGPSIERFFLGGGVAREGYTPAALAARVRNNFDSKQANKAGNSMLLYFLLFFFHTTPLQDVPQGLFFPFLSPPPPRLPVCVGARGWGDGECRVM